MIIDFRQVRTIHLKPSVLIYRLYYEHIIHFEIPERQLKERDIYYLDQLKLSADFYQI